jgi:hypothetical protein
MAFVFLGLALVLASGGAALASTVEVTLTGAGGVVSNDHSVYVGPYQLSLQVIGPDGLGPPIPINAPCDDYSDEIWVGESWQASEIPLADYGSALFGGQTDAQQKYWAAAYLTFLFNSPGGYSENDISFAIWGLFDPAALSSSDDGGVAGNLASNALNLASIQNDNLNDFPGWEILTPLDGTQTQGGQPQEFIIPGGNPSLTPEPATLALLGSGLLAVGLAWRRKRASSTLA